MQGVDRIGLLCRWGLMALIVGLCVLLHACKSDEKDPVLAPTYGAEYVNFERNHFIDYRLDTLDQNVLPVPREETGTIYERHLVRDTLETTELYRAYEIGIYRRATTADDWQLKRLDVAFERFDGAVVVQSRGTQTQILALPFYKGVNWNLNAYNTQDQAPAYTIRFKGFDADSVAQFSGVRDSTCLSSKLEQLGFKRGVGLVSRHSYSATFVEDPLNPCAEPVTYQTRIRRNWTYLGSGKL